jgi:hypothetical protein
MRTISTANLHGSRWVGATNFHQENHEVGRQYNLGIMLRFSKHGRHCLSRALSSNSSSLTQISDETKKILTDRPLPSALLPWELDESKSPKTESVEKYKKKLAMRIDKELISWEKELELNDKDRIDYVDRMGITVTPPGPDELVCASYRTQGHSVRIRFAMSADADLMLMPTKDQEEAKDDIVSENPLAYGMDLYSFSADVIADGSTDVLQVFGSSGFEVRLHS